MIDMSKLIRESFTSVELEGHIFDEYGGNSLVMLKRLLEKDFDYLSIGSSFDEILCDSLKSYGPGLVSCFEAHDDFLNNNVHCHAGSPEGEVVGLHSMLLIGFRVDSAGKKYFLIQYWWKRKQFFVTTPQNHILKEFDVNMGSYVECENLDKPESYRFEG